MSKAPEAILKLVETFEQNLENFKNQTYNEAQVRQEFINPFFDALGWDMQNKSQTAAAYKDVIHEDAIKVGGSTKAPDYCFRIGGTRKFFLEAKKPSVDIKSDVSPAYQLRRYAWSAKLPLSILTDFEEFAVYDCQTRPNVNDKPSVGRILIFNYKDYAAKWQQIAEIFSKEAVLKGAFDKFATTKTKKGTTTVDKEFLASIEDWRNELAKNIAIRNEKLSVYDLNFAVQKTIDRILFLRICEDRGIERSEQLLGLTGGGRIYPRLYELFEKADERYNSGLFYFHPDKDRPESPDEMSAKLKVDDGILKKIIGDLYYPQSPYEFSVLPAEILGNVYEQFLGKVIRLTAGHQAKVEEKPEVKKAGGVYYTPAYIVDYIVKNTVGKLCEGKTPKQIEKIKILDPACGSGSFLIGAYQYLLDWHRDYYVGGEKGEKSVKGVKSGKGGKDNKVYQGKGGLWYLTIEEKKRILLNNIFGVDIDSQAVEVTKLSLLLKVLENETSESLRLFHERALPDLGNNIKCGNSLIGPDFYQNQQMSFGFDDEEQRKINAFDWKKEFAAIFKQGGFDAVIGNPPYVRVDIIQDIQKKYLKGKYLSAQGKYDLYYPFVESSLNSLSNGGWFGFIIPNRFCTSTSGESLRKIIAGKSNEVFINSVSKLKIFENAANYPVLLIVNKNTKERKPQIIFYTTHTHSELYSPDTVCLYRKDWQLLPMSLFPINATDELLKISLKFIEKFPFLEKFLSISEGFRIPPSMETESGDVHILKQYQFSRYSKIKLGTFLSTKSRESIISNDSKRYIDGLKPKLVFAEDALRIEATIDSEKSVCQGGVYFGTIKNDDLKHFMIYLLGLLNSKLLTTIYSTLYSGMHMGGGYMRFRTTFLNALPIRTIDFKKPAEVKQHDKMVGLVERMLELNKKIAGIKNPEEKTRMQRQIEATDGQIDKLVYELYGLTEDEIKIVEGEK